MEGGCSRVAERRRRVAHPVGGPMRRGVGSIVQLTMNPAETTMQPSPPRITTPGTSTPQPKTNRRRCGVPTWRLRTDQRLPPSDCVEGPRDQAPTPPAAGGRRRTPSSGWLRSAAPQAPPSAFEFARTQPGRQRRRRAAAPRRTTTAAGPAGLRTCWNARRCSTRREPAAVLGRTARRRRPASHNGDLSHTRETTEDRPV